MTVIVWSKSNQNRVSWVREFSKLIVSHRFRDLGSIVNRHSCVKSSK